MRLIIEMSDVEHNDLKVFAAKNRMTMRQVVLKSINAYMGRPNLEVKPIKRERYDQFMDIFKKSNLSTKEAAEKMDMTEEDFNDLVKKIKPVTGDILVDADIHLSPPNVD